MANPAIHDLVASQFGEHASGYVTSPTHADTASLAELVRLVAPDLEDYLLDVATGAGHTALAFAPHVAKVIAYDLTPRMLEETARLAAERNLSNVTTQQGLAEQMPFEDQQFDIVTVRTAPHHFSDIPAFLDESFRVLKPGGKLLVADTTVPEDDETADEINRIEKLRDPSHGRNLKSSEWTRLVEAAGFHITSLKEGWHANGKKMEVHQWMDRIGTAQAVRTEILISLTNASPALTQALQIEPKENTLWFTLPELTLLATK